MTPLRVLIFVLHQGIFLTVLDGIPHHPWCRLVAGVWCGMLLIQLGIAYPPRIKVKP